MQVAIEGDGRDVTRYFTSDLELVRFDGATYAISNQWGTRSLEAVASMIARCKPVLINCERVS